MYTQIDATNVSYIYGVLIDIREEYEYEAGHIPNAINIPMDKLLATPEKYLNGGKVYYIYCEKGIRSKKVCQILFKLYYHVVEIKGGYNEWQTLRKKY